MKSTIQISRTISNSQLLAWQKLWDTSDYSSLVNGPQWFQSVRATFPEMPFCIIAIFEQSDLIGITVMFQSKLLGISVYTIPPNDIVTGIVS